MAGGLAAGIVVLIFLRTDCPISNRYAPEIERLYREFSPRGVEFSLVYPGSHESPARVQEHARQYGLSGKLVLDPDHKLAKRAGVHITPEAAVFSPEDHLVYRGRIDDRYVSLSRFRPAPSVHDLENAILAILRDHTVPRAAGPPFGCEIE